jgi:NAD(P)-dependent dehydrogenase (short-subunit alcohol dehydrogenase family)
MNRKTVLITGATDGIGKQTAIELAAKGYRVIIHGRAEGSINNALKEISDLTGSKFLSTVYADLASLKSVHQLAGEIKNKYPVIDVMINNAGIYMKELKFSEDGYEMTFAVNHLSHFLLTNLLLDLLKKSDDGRVVNVSSAAHQNVKYDWDNLNAEKHFGGYAAYSLSKLANVLFSNELSDRLKGTTVKSNSLHPGVITTKLLRAGFNMSGASVKKGAETSVYLATSDSAASINGEYLIDCKISKPHPISKEKEVLEKFWEVSAKMTGLNS